MSREGRPRRPAPPRGARTAPAHRAAAGRGRGAAHCVRLSDAVADLFEQAKPESQSMPEFLREAGLTIALQRLEESQA